MFLQEQIKDIIIIIMPHYLLRLRHLLLLVSEPRLLHGRLRVLGVLRPMGPPNSVCSKSVERL